MGYASFNLAMNCVRRIGVVLTLLGFATTAWAQSSLEIPQPQSQNPVSVPSVRPRNTPIPEQQGENSTLQIAPVPTPAPNAAGPAAPGPQYQDPMVAAAAAAAAAVNSLLMAQPPVGSSPVMGPTPAPMAPSFATQSTAKLPSVFRGCWQGVVTTVDDLEQIPGGHKVGYWTPKTYRLCYKRVGDGPFKLTISETGVVPNFQITNVVGNVDALATDGREYARMRSNLHFDEYHVEKGHRRSTFSVDEVTMLDCKIAGDTMTVDAGVYGTRDGDPWFKARWHAEFAHVVN